MEKKIKILVQNPGIARVLKGEGGLVINLSSKSTYLWFQDSWQDNDFGNDLSINHNEDSNINGCFL